MFSLPSNQEVCEMWQVENSRKTVFRQAILQQSSPAKGNEQLQRPVGCPHVETSVTRVHTQLRKSFFFQMTHRFSVCSTVTQYHLHELWSAGNTSQSHRKDGASAILSLRHLMISFRRADRLYVISWLVFIWRFAVWAFQLRNGIAFRWPIQA